MEKVTLKIFDDISSLTLEEKENLLSEIRRRVVELDKEIVRLLGKRAEHSRLIGKMKSELKIPVFSSEREKEILSKLLESIPQTISKKSLLRIYERILDESRIIQHEERKKSE